MTGYDGSALLVALPATVGAILVLMGLTFAVALRVGKHAVIDVTWGLGFAVVAATAYVLHTGDGTRAAVMLGIVALWGVITLVIGMAASKVELVTAAGPRMLQNH